MNEQVILRDLKKEDTSLTWKWRNQPEVQDHFSGHPFSVTHTQEEDWFENHVRENEALKVFAIERKSDKRLCGMTFLKNISKHHLQAEFAILIDQDLAGQGLGKEACRKTLVYAFSELKLHRVFLKVRVDNSAAIRIYESCFFKKEGELRDDVFKNNKYYNVFIMSVLESEFT